jgi:hypothetical protein
VSKDLIPDDLPSLIEEERARGWTGIAEKDKAFAFEYITNGFNHREAAVSIGMAPGSGISKLRHPLVGAFIQYLQEQSNKAKFITQQFVEQQYLEILPKLKGEEEVDIVDIKEGTSFKAKKFHSAELVSTLRDLGKSSGYIAPDTGPKGSMVNVQINMGNFVGDDPVEVIIDDPATE